MGLIPENPTVNKAFKGAIAIGMVGAMLLPLYKLYVLSHGGSLPSTLNTLVMVTYVVLVAHVIEAVVGGAIAFRRGDNVLKAGLYAFFTGFVGLSEMLKAE